jgi:fatty-acyl-CoA synthase
LSSIGTPTINSLPLRQADFATLSEALEYASHGETGYNFYDGRGKLYRSLPYSALYQQAQVIATKLNSLQLPRGSRMVLVAETCPDFVRFFFACQLAGLTPVPVPAAVHLGGREAYIKQLRRLIQSCAPSLAMAPPDYLDMLQSACDSLDVAHVGGADYYEGLASHPAPLQPLQPDELAYLQYTSGSTQFPRGVMISQSAVMHNLNGILEYGLDMGAQDRCVSWLPFYHDMGLVGLLLAPMSTQRSVDYIGTRDFAMRPRLWLNIMSQTGGTVSFSPPFGYELCARRVRPTDIERLDLSGWRVAGVGAETIRPSSLRNFAEALRPAGFKANSFLACYGMAEVSLAISFAPLGREVIIDSVDADHLGQNHVAIDLTVGASASGPSTTQVNPSPRVNPGTRVNHFVRCGHSLPGMDVEIRNAEGQTLPDRHCGTIYVRGPSLMSGYLNEPEITARVLSADGWLNTGDMGYVIDGEIIITGRQKDMIIINGRNIWPQDLEYIAERQPEIRPEDASAFAVVEDDNREVAVMVVQCRQADPAVRSDLAERLRAAVHEEMGIECRIDLVPPHTLPRTSSGKLSRSGAKQDYLQRLQQTTKTAATISTRLPQTSSVDG